MPDDVGCFGVDVVHDGSTVLVSVVGELDLATAPVLRARLEPVVAERPGIVVLDTSRVPFVDSAGIAAVLGTYRQLQAEGGELRLGPMSDGVERVFAVAGILDQLPRSGDAAGGG